MPGQKRQERRHGQIYFGSIANSGNGADLNDYKEDGKVNLLKYAFGLNPTLSNPGQIPQPQRNGPNFVATFPQPADVSGITSDAEWSTTLLHGSWTPIGAAHEARRMTRRTNRDICAATANAFGGEMLHQ